MKTKRRPRWKGKSAGGGRGLWIYTEFKDTYGTEVVVQTSSAATRACVWIVGRSRDDDRDATPHLNVPQARKVRDALDQFIREFG